MPKRTPPSTNPFESSRDRSYGFIDRSWARGTIVDDVPIPNQSAVTLERRKPRTEIVGILILIASFFLIGRAFALQVVEGSERLDQAEQNRIRRESLPAMRGLLFDRNGQPLVKNIPNFIVTVTPYLLPKTERERLIVLDRLAKLVAIDRPSLLESITKAGLGSREPIVAAERLSEDQAILLTTVADDLSGVRLETVAVREYFNGPTDSHVLGYVGRVTTDDLERQPTKYSPIDYLGKTGLEYAYESELRGRQGYRDVERDHLNREKRIIASVAPTPGRNLRTTLDRRVQAALSQALANAIDRTDSPGGAAVALDPRTGEVLALVSVPSFDSNVFIRGLSREAYTELLDDPAKPFLNRATSGVFPSGSTIKPLVASAALEEGLVAPSTKIQSTGGIKIDKWFFPDWKAGGHGTTDLTKALAESVNTYFYLIGGGDETTEGLGVNRLNRYMKLFGLSEPLGIDLPNEQSGFLPTKEWKERAKGEPWYIGDTYHYAIGQGDVLVTPLQIAAATATVANRGTLFRPRLAQAWLNQDLQETERVGPEVIRENFIKPSHLDAVRRGLREAVVSGSARALSAFPFPVAGKTGTAEVGESGATHAWFTAFAPYESPEIVITVLVERGGEGHASALPVATAGFRAYFGLDSQP